MAEGILNPIEQLEADLDFEVYTKQEVDALLDEKADKSNTYTKTETDALLDDKADADAVYTKIETDTLLSAKADKSTTLAGYGITDAYTKTQTDNLLNGKADTNSVYTKEETDNLLSVKADSADVYTKTETNNLLSAKADSANVYTKTESNTLLAGKANVDDVYTKMEIDNQLTVTKDGTWVKVAQTTAINLEKLEGGIEYLYGLLSYKYSQLRKYINGNYYDYETDTDSAYTKSVPAGAMPYAGLESLGGKTVVWNQAEPVISSADWEQYASTYTSVSFSDGVATVTVINDSSSSGYHYGFGRKTAHSIISGHVYIFLYDIRSNNAGTSFSDETISTNGGFTNVATNANQWYSFCSIQTANKSTTKCLIKPLNNRTGLIFDVRNVMLIDLTLLYGSGNEPSTVEEFQQMFPASYYPYNAGELLSAGVTEVVSKGKNLVDTSTLVQGTFNTSNGSEFPSTTRVRTDYIEVDSEKNYVLSVDAPAKLFYIYYYRSDKSFVKYTLLNYNVQSVMITTPVDTKYMRILYHFTDNSTIVPSDVVNPTVYPQNNIIATYPIPSSIQSLEGYGWSAGSVYNYIDYERKVFVKNVGKVVLDGTQTMGTYSFASPQCRCSYKVTGIETTTDTVNVDNKIVSSYLPNGSNTDSQNGVPCVFRRSNGSAEIFVSLGSIGISAGVTDVTGFNAYLTSHPLTVLYPLATPIETDISAYLSDDNLIEVEAGGTLTFPNSNGDNYRIPVPSEEEYMIDLQEAVSNG